jgi:eukaryotic-like serine/threonine-protein kinase
MKRTLICAAMLFAMLVAPALARAADPGTPATQSDSKATTQPAKTLTLDLGNKVTMKLLLIPPGTFQMGSPQVESALQQNEAPQHEVTITKAFYIGMFPVTQQQYEPIAGKNPSEFKAPANPVDSASWEDAADFCKKLSQKAGKTVRLATEAEWEYACRAGTATRFYYGDDDAACSKLGDFAWWGGNAGGKTHPVGQKKPNAWGLYDMHGNVWQWVADWYDDNYYASSPKADPNGPDSGTLRVVRGGGWIANKPIICRSADRNRQKPDFRHHGFGFRVVVEVEKK